MASEKETAEDSKNQEVEMKDMSDAEAKNEEKSEVKENPDEDNGEEVVENKENGGDADVEDEKPELSSPRTPGSGRPTRERKTVERFASSVSPRGLSAKPLSIQKGQGTQLKDIPNVAFKLSKRKADENLQALHGILFGKRSKVHTLKKNIGLFSGYVWAEDEEKQRAKMKERLDKCTKEKLLDFCDVLNIPVNKATVKEEVSVKVLEFLESPHATTDTLLAEKDKKRKAKRSASRKKISSKKLKKDSKSGKKRPRSSKNEEQESGESEPSQSEDDQEDENDEDARAESDQENKNSSEEDVEQDQDEDKKQISPENHYSKKSSKKDTSNMTPEKSKHVSGESIKSPAKKSTSSKKNASEAKSSLTKKQKVEKESEKDAATGKASGKKQSSKSPAKTPEKDQGKAKSSKKAKKEPSNEEIHAAVVKILKEVDFNIATLSDILRQLGKDFGVDLMHRKADVKAIIAEAINKMSDEEDDEAAGSGDNSEKDGNNDKDGGDDKDEA